MLFPDFVSRTIIAASEAVEAYRAIQESPERLTVELQTTDVADASTAEQQIRTALAQLCERIGARTPDIEFAPYDFLPGAVKLRRVQRRFAVDERMEPV